jgi:hypothetical protein
MEGLALRFCNSYSLFTPLSGLGRAGGIAYALS